MKWLQARVRSPGPTTEVTTASLPNGDADSPLHDLYANLEDAERMLAFAAGLSDIRVRRMRADQKQTLGAALHVPSDRRESLERAEGAEAWIIIKPGANLRRDMFGAEALKPLVRQSVVVAAAAVEVYIAARVNGILQEMLASPALSPAAREVLVNAIEIRSSAAPSMIRGAFRRLGIDVDLTKIRIEDGALASDVLGQLAEVRNRIAHGSTADCPEVLQARKLVLQVRHVIERLDLVIAENHRATRAT